MNTKAFRPTDGTWFTFPILKQKPITIGKRFPLRTLPTACHMHPGTEAQRFYSPTTAKGQ